MNGWDVLASLGWGFVWIWVAVCTAFVVLLLVNHAYDLIRGRIIKRYQASVIWQEAYEQGKNDERQAIEWDVTEYPTGARQNPYGDPTRFEGDFRAH